MVSQHPGHVQVLDDEPVVGLDQRVGHLVQEMPAHIGDVMVVTPQLGCGVAAVLDPFCLRDNDFASRRWRFIPAASALGASVMRATSVPSAVAATRNADKPRSMPTQPPRSCGSRAGCWWAGCSSAASTVQRHPPAPPMMGDGGEQDLGAVLGEHAPQPAGVVMHPDLPDAGQGDRAGAAACRRPGSPTGGLLGVLVAQPKRRHRTGLLLEAGKADPLAFALTERESDHAASALPAVHGGFLEHLLAHPARHGRPVTTVSATPSVSTVKTRPASSDFFQPLNVLIRSNPVHGTSACPDRSRAA